VTRGNRAKAKAPWVRDLHAIYEDINKCEIIR
jgi:hypothetical protein